MGGPIARRLAEAGHSVRAWNRTRAKAEGLGAEAFPTFSRKLVWLGEEIGAASALKLVLNHWILNTVENVGETVALAQALGVDPRLFLESIAGGGMDMPYAHMKTEALLSGDL